MFSPNSVRGLAAEVETRPILHEAIAVSVGVTTWHVLGPVGFLGQYTTVCGCVGTWGTRKRSNNVSFNPVQMPYAMPVLASFLDMPHIFLSLP